MTIVSEVWRGSRISGKSSVSGGCEETTRIILRDRTGAIGNQLDDLEGMLAGVVGPRLKEGPVSEAVEGSLFDLEVALMSIVARLEGICDMVREIELLI